MKEWNLDYVCPLKRVQNIYVSRDQKYAMGFVFYTFCAISVIFIAGWSFSPNQPRRRANMYLDVSETMNTSDDETDTGLGGLKAPIPVHSIVPYLTLGLGLFSAALSVNFYCHKPVHFAELTTSELVDVLMEKEDVMTEIKRRWDSPKVPARFSKVTP